jgi:hypothetical protein
MRPNGAWFCAMILLSLVSIKVLRAYQVPSNVPTIQVTSRLVFLDVTVLDKKGRPVVKGLTKDDFTITDNKKLQRIFSFGAPETHVEDANATDDYPAGKAPVTIFVLDLLNSKFEDFAYIRYMVHKYLAAQPAQMNSPAELMCWEIIRWRWCRVTHEARRTCFTRWIMCRLRRWVAVFSANDSVNLSMPCSKLHCKTEVSPGGRT